MDLSGEPHEAKPSPHGNRTPVPTLGTSLGGQLTSFGRFGEQKKSLGPTANQTPIPWSTTSWSSDYPNVSHKRPKTTCKVGKFREHSLYSVIGTYSILQ